jgi:hypothetical protein
MKLVCLAVLTLLLVPSIAQAEERQLATGGASALTADGGWISFLAGTERLAGRGDSFQRVGTMAGLEIGTDSRGRAVGLFSVCPRGRRCTLRQRLMPRGRARVVLRYSRRLLGFRADRARGVLATARAPVGPNRDTLIEVRRRGKRTVRRSERGSVLQLESERGRVLVTLFRGEEVVLRELRPGRRGLIARTIAVDSQFDDDCKCTSTATRLHGLSADGRYAYWIEEFFQTRGGEPLGGGYPTDITTRIVRADLGARPQANAAVDLPRPSNEVAVDQGRILYNGRDGSGGLYELTEPAWRPIGTGRRVVGPIPPSE